MFTLKEFQLGSRTIRLELPEESHAKALFKIVENDREELKKWMPWAKTTKHLRDEVNFMKYAREQMINHHLFMLTILCDDEPVGMIDLHEIDPIDRHAQVGYWLSSQYQGLGIMTASLKQLISVGFGQLNLHKIVVMADSVNEKSKAIPERLGFIHEATLKDEVYMNGDFKDLDVYAKFADEDMHHS